MNICTSGVRACRRGDSSVMRDALSLDLPPHPNEHVYLTRPCDVYFLSDYHFSLS